MAAKKTPAKKKVTTTTAKKAAQKSASKKVEGEASPPKLSPFVAKQKQRLLDLRDELLDAMSGMTGEIRNTGRVGDVSAAGEHSGDAGSDTYDRDFALSVLAKEQDACYEIDRALERIDHGVYGICQISGEKIGQARLEAIPFARLTVACQSKWEQEHGPNVRFKPDSERGLSSE